MDMRSLFSDLSTLQCLGRTSAGRDNDMHGSVDVPHHWRYLWPLTPSGEGLDLSPVA